MSAKYCKRVGCSCDQTEPCAAADDCVLFQWDLDRIKSVQPKRGDSRTPTEAEEQEELVAWCEMKRIPIIHIPNERKCSAAAAASLSRQGLRTDSGREVSRFVYRAETREKEPVEGLARAKGMGKGFERTGL